MDKFKVIYVDIDETICITPENRDYSQAEPIKENIQAINSLYIKGHTVIYWTARGSTKRISHFRETYDQLIRWGALFSELRCGKPQYDVFICDKALNVKDLNKLEEIL